MRQEGPHAQTDQHERGEKLERERQPKWHRQTKEHQRAAHEQDAQGMPESPCRADPGGRARRPTPGHDRTDGGDVIGVGRVPHAENEAEDERGEKRHVSGVGDKIAACHLQRPCRV
jgi:hypothetical protein